MCPSVLSGPGWARFLLLTALRAPQGLRSPCEQSLPSTFLQSLHLDLLGSAGILMTTLPQLLPLSGHCVPSHFQTPLESWPNSPLHLLPLLAPLGFGLHLSLHQALPLGVLKASPGPVPMCSFSKPCPLGSGLSWPVWLLPCSPLHTSPATRGLQPVSWAILSLTRDHGFSSHLCAADTHIFLCSPRLQAPSTAASSVSIWRFPRAPEPVSPPSPPEPPAASSCSPQTHSSLFFTTSANSSGCPGVLI